MDRQQQMDQARAALDEANATEQEALQAAIQRKQDLDEILLEEEVQKQAVYYDISEDEARSRIEQNRQERVEGQSRTLFRPPNLSDAEWEVAKEAWIRKGGNA